MHWLHMNYRYWMGLQFFSPAWWNSISWPVACYKQLGSGPETMGIRSLTLPRPLADSCDYQSSLPCALHAQYAHPTDRRGQAVFSSGQESNMLKTHVKTHQRNVESHCLQHILLRPREKESFSFNITHHCVASTNWMATQLLFKAWL